MAGRVKRGHPFLIGIMTIFIAAMSLPMAHNAWQRFNYRPQTDIDPGTVQHVEGRVWLVLARRYNQLIVATPDGKTTIYCGVGSDPSSWCLSALQEQGVKDGDRLALSYAMVDEVGGWKRPVLLSARSKNVDLLPPARGLAEFQRASTASSRTQRWMKYLYALLGLGAAFLVPYFLWRVLSPQRLDATSEARPDQS